MAMALASAGPIDRGTKDCSSLSAKTNHGQQRFPIDADHFHFHAHHLLTPPRRLSLSLADCRFDKADKQGVRSGWPRLELGMKLGTHKPGVIWQFHNLNQFHRLGDRPLNCKARFNQQFAVAVVKFINGVDVFRG